MKSLLKLLPYVRPYTWLIVVSILLAFPLSALRLSPAPLVKFMMDDLLKGEVPSPLNPPSGCRFRTRCWKATDVCVQELPVATPDLRVAGHSAECHHPLTDESALSRSA